MVEYLDRKYYQPRKMQMRACHPRDLIEQVVDRCRYEDREPAITRELLDQACGATSSRNRLRRVTNNEVRLSLADAAPSRGSRRPARSASISTWLDGRRIQAQERRARSARLRGPSRANPRHRVVLVHGGQDRRRLPRDRPADRTAPARERSAGRRPDGLPARARGRRPQHARARVDGAVAARPAARAAVARSRRSRRRSSRSALSALGLLVVIAGKVSLGRSFGLIPANRGIVSHRALPPRAASHLSRLPHHARRVRRRQPDDVERGGARDCRHRAAGARRLRRETLARDEAYRALSDHASAGASFRGCSRARASSSRISVSADPQHDLSS